MSERRRLTVLGSTGSVGLQTLDVVRAHPERFEVVALSAATNAGVLREQAREFSPEYVALEAGDPKGLEGLDATVLAGAGSSAKLAEVPADVVLNAIVGFAGLAATVRALENHNRVALANKESLVTGGEWVMKLARDRDNPIIPVDSEHSAIFQCLEGRKEAEVSGVLLTASGGPFFGQEDLGGLGPEEALEHPTWRMGPKITVDSATMMNKGLEVIEAHHLFGVAYDAVKVVVHRQSVVHGGALFNDGAVVLHAGTPDMRLPISYGVFYPERVGVGVEAVPFGGSTWTFEEPRNDAFRCLPLAVEAGRRGGAHPVALNAANEVAVGAFLDRRIEFLCIADVVEEVLQGVPEFGAMQSMEAITGVDAWAREEAGRAVKRAEAR